MKSYTLWSYDQLLEKRCELISEIARHDRRLQKLTVQTMRQQTIERMITAQDQLREIEDEIDRQYRAENRETFFLTNY